MGAAWSAVFTSRRSRAFLYGTIALLILLTILGVPGSRDRVVGNIYGTSNQARIAIHNRTLGFQRVYAIGMAGRTDKRDALTLAASWSEVDIEWSDGVAYEDMPAKAVPEAFINNPNNIKPTVIGSWRAHMNVLSSMVQENIQTALILEDDVDWDFSLKQQLEAFAYGATELQKDDPGTNSQGSPYGNNWDTLWLGHCRAGPSSDKQKLYFLRNDTTVPPLPFRRAIWQNEHIIPEILSNDTRTIFRAQSAGCTFAYSMTLKAARNVLAALSLHASGTIYDVAMARMCNGRFVKPYTCYSIYPPLFSSHRFAGSANRDSDIQERKKMRQHDEFTYDIVYSVIQNVPTLFAGGSEVFSQWPEDTIPTRGTNYQYLNEISTEEVNFSFENVQAERIAGINAPQAWEDPALFEDDDADAS